MNIIRYSALKKLVFLVCVITAPSVLAEDKAFLSDEANDVALALGGGGFLSTTEQAGFTAGLLAYALNQDQSLGLENSLYESGLFGNVTSINSISGGSWFAAKLIYSKKYVHLMEMLAYAKARKQADPASLSDIFEKNDVFQKLVDTAQNELLASKCFKVLERLFPGIDAIQDLRAYGEYIGLILKVARDQKGKNPINWQTVVDYYILGDDDKDVTFGSDVQDWSKGKTWRIIVTVVTATKKKPDFLFKTKFNNLLHYTMHPEPNQQFYPARFSAVLGYPDKKADEYDSCPHDSHQCVPLEEQNVVYKGKDLNEECLFDLLPDKTKIKSAGGISADASTLMMDKDQNFSDMPISGPVSGSSAFLGTLPLNKFIADILGDINIFDPAIYFAPKAKQEEAFSKPLEIMHEIWKTKDPTSERIQELANMGTHAIADGGAVDDQGISTAVATGAKHVFVMAVIEGNQMSWRERFTGFKPLCEKKSPSPQSQELIEIKEIFKEDQTYADKIEAEFHHWGKGTKNNYKILEGITYGKFTATTKKNDYWGITDDNPVTLYFFNVNVCNSVAKKDKNCKKLVCGENGRKKGISLGVNVDFRDYAVLVGEIVDLMNSDDKQIKEDMAEIVELLNLSPTKTGVKDEF